MLLCADMWKRRDVLHAAYCDREGVTEAFIKNGLRHAFGSLACAAAADPANWDYEVSQLAVRRRATLSIMSAL